MMPKLNPLRETDCREPREHHDSSTADAAKPSSSPAVTSKSQRALTSLERQASTAPSSKVVTILRENERAPLGLRAATPPSPRSCCAKRVARRNGSR